ncbi:MAG: potassium channel family protein [Pseudomonadota bacterium]
MTPLVRRLLAPVERWRFTLLLALLILAFFMAPLLRTTILGDALQILLYASIFGAVVHLSREALGGRGFGAATVGLWVVITVLTEQVGGAFLPALALFVTIGLVAWMTACTLSLLFQETEADGDALAGAVFGYFLLTLLWSLLFVALQIWVPGSIGVAEGTTDLHTEMLYFSLVTFTTLGYGDVLPTTPFAKIMAGIAGAMGTLYLAILIGRVVSVIKGPKARRDDRPGAAETAPPEAPER